MGGFFEHGCAGVSFRLRLDQLGMALAKVFFFLVGCNSAWSGVPWKFRASWAFLQLFRTSLLWMDVSRRLFPGQSR
jgi:hypothetical protein